MAYFLTELASFSFPLSVAGQQPRVKSRSSFLFFGEIVFLISCVAASYDSRNQTRGCFIIKRSIFLALFLFARLVLFPQIYLWPWLVEWRERAVSV